MGQFGGWVWRSVEGLERAGALRDVGGGAHLGGPLPGQKSGHLGGRWDPGIDGGITLERSFVSCWASVAGAPWEEACDDIWINVCAMSMGSDDMHSDVDRWRYTCVHTSECIHARARLKTCAQTASVVRRCCMRTRRWGARVLWGRSRPAALRRAEAASCATLAASRSARPRHRCRSGPSGAPAASRRSGTSPGLAPLATGSGLAAGRPGVRRGGWRLVAQGGHLSKLGRREGAWTPGRPRACTGVVPNRAELDR